MRTLREGLVFLASLVVKERRYAGSPAAYAGNRTFVPIKFGVQDWTAMVDRYQFRQKNQLPLFQEDWPVVISFPASAWVGQGGVVLCIDYKTYSMPRQDKENLYRGIADTVYWENY